MKVDWQLPWEAIDDAKIVEALLQELQREMSPRHVLFDVELRAIARRIDNDDVAFVLADGRIAVVHLTWTGRAEVRDAWPSTVFFESEDAFRAQQVDSQQADRRAIDTP